MNNKLGYSNNNKLGYIINNKLRYNSNSKLESSIKFNWGTSTRII